jgi:hypothetical protein
MANKIFSAAPPRKPACPYGPPKKMEFKKVYWRGSFDTVITAETFKKVASVLQVPIADVCLDYDIKSDDYDEYDCGYCGCYCDLEFYTEKEYVNPHYEKQLIKYNKDLIKYSRKMEEYNKKFAVYQEKVKTYKEVFKLS